MKALDLIEQANGKRLTKRQTANAKSAALALDEYGAQVGLNQPHRLVQYLAQLAHESAGFVHDREVWGPTAAQKRYEGRADLGNTQPGDGKKFSGHGPIQVTGRANHSEFTQWCRKMFPHLDVPDFEANPEAINTDPWEGLTGIWYWSTRNLNRYADSGDVEMITKRINGGLNGYQDRIDKLVRFSLVANGFAPDDVIGFQKAADMEMIDGIAGPKTRALLHKSLVALTEIEAQSGDVKDAPVTQDKPVVPKEVETEVKKKTDFFGWLMGLFGGISSGLAYLADWEGSSILALGAVGICGLLIVAFLGPQLARSVRSIKEALEQ